jgi:DNA-binding NarL/FixJ family response regulator
MAVWPPVFATLRNKNGTGCDGAADKTDADERGNGSVEQVRTAVVVDEWELLATGVSAVLAELGIRTVAAARDPRTGLRVAREHRPDLLVLGSSGGVSPEDAVTQAGKLRPRPLLMVLLTGVASDPAALLAAGADGLVLRSAPSAEIADAVQRVSNGERVVARAVLPALLGAVSPAPANGSTHSRLTGREREVLNRLAAGRSNRQIADELFVGEETVKSHLSKVYAKLQARDRHDAVARALAAGLLG